MTEAVIVNAETGEQEVRPLTAAEQEQRNLDDADAAAQEQAEADAEAAKAKAEQDWRDAVGKAATLDEVKAALLGTNLPAQPDVRPKS